MKATLLATLTALVMLLTALAVQLWLLDVMFERDVRARIATGTGGVYAEVQDVNLLPAFVLAVGAFVGVFTWRIWRQHHTVS